MSQIVLETLDAAFPNRRVRTQTYDRFEMAPRGSIYVPRNYDRANIPVSELENGRFPYNDRLRAFCEAQCRVYTSGRIHEFHVLPHQIDRVVAILQHGS